MLFFDTQASFQTYASADADIMQSAIGKTIKLVKAKQKYSYALSSMAAQANDNMRENQQKYQEKYGVKFKWLSDKVKKLEITNFKLKLLVEATQLPMHFALFFISAASALQFLASFLTFVHDTL